MTQIIDGKKISQEIKDELKEKGLNVNTEATTVAEARESLLEVLIGRVPHQVEIMEDLC